MSRVFERVAILGLGLLGGSVARAARKAGLASRVVGYARRRGPLEYALAEGIVDEIADLKGAVSGADLIVLASPVGAMQALVAEAAPWLREGAWRRVIPWLRSSRRWASAESPAAKELPQDAPGWFRVSASGLCRTPAIESRW